MLYEVITVTNRHNWSGYLAVVTGKIHVTWALLRIGTALALLVITSYSIHYTKLYEAREHLVKNGNNFDQQDGGDNDCYDNNGGRIG